MHFKSKDLALQVVEGPGLDTPCCPCRSTGEEWQQGPGGSLDDLRKQLRAALETRTP